MSRVLVVRPADDPTAVVLSNWADEVIRALWSSGSHTYHDLQSSHATRLLTEAEINNSTDFLVYFGHGDADKLYAHGTLAANKPAAVDTSNANLLASKIVFAIACLSADTLGVDAVNTHTAKTYIGYDDKLFIVFGGAEYWFQKAANVGILQLVLSSNFNCGDAVDRMTREYDDAIDYYQTGGGVGHYDAAHAIKYLQHDRDHLQLIGSRLATL